MEWYYADGSDQQQPTSEDSLAGLVASGVIHPKTLLWNETLVDWKAAIELRPDLFGSAVVPPVLSPAQRRDISLGATGISGQSASADPVAVCALIFGILGLFCLPFLGIVGVVCGHIARKRAKEETVPSSNGGLALAGLITGYIGVVISVVVTIVYGALILAMIVGAGSEGFEIP